jgi:hypothetical protein
MMMTSNNKMATVTPKVTIHSSWDTFMQSLRSSQNAGGLFRRDCGPRGRPTSDGQRDDDTATKEYSPPLSFSHAGWIRAGRPLRTRGMTGFGTG